MGSIADEINDIVDVHISVHAVCRLAEQTLAVAPGTATCGNRRAAYGLETMARALACWLCLYALPVWRCRIADALGVAPGEPARRARLIEDMRRSAPARAATDALLETARWEVEKALTPWLTRQRAFSSHSA